MKILQYALPRSGSSLLKQILRELELDEHIHSHEFVGDCEWDMVGTVRDFRDVFISHWRIWFGQIEDGKLINIPTLSQISDMLKTVQVKIDVLNTYEEKYKGRVLWLRYEDFYNNHDYIFDKLEKFLGLTISREKREEIKENTSLEANRKRQDSVKIVDKKRIFNNVDGDIHANHISPIDPEQGYWKDIVKPEHYEIIEGFFAKELKSWGYK